MTLHARDFFAELSLPFTDSHVVGDTYLATPDPGGPLRLRIDFTRARADVYDGLRLAVIHRDRGELDVVVLRFDDHKTFDHRDSTLGHSPTSMGYAVFHDFRERPDIVPWRGAHTNGLRDAIEQYSAVWFPGAWRPPSRVRASSRAPVKAPAPPAARGAGRAR
ncbi:hypothetical protein RM572_26430 [Streptomyces sp. DSM 42041]|uniref:Uncharacterized protein n=1 Tax=Streptomyces hazeniae TaxID=3075538 RepID=A0ABU2P068_9ACTN|nr:hypothetical protein [Streptomyces sp. DSM 42041]MDT0382300.1 hypothetical protein [Streptomyces sp. DSM 42041]